MEIILTLLWNIIDSILGFAIILLILHILFNRNYDQDYPHEEDD